MKTGARNDLVGMVETIKKGSLMALVKVRTGCGCALSSVMTRDSLKEMGIKKGSKVRVLVKAVNVLLISE
jgi:molybdate transport system regulatory protein